MARRKIRKQKKQIRAYIYSNKFRILRNRSKGLAHIEVEIDEGDGVGKNFKFDVPIISCWVNRYDGNAVKVHMKGDVSNPAHMKFIETVLANGFSDGSNGHFSVERNGLIRFGTSPREQVYRGYTKTDYTTYFVYDSKAEAISDILTRINGRIPLGGINLINLSILGDSVLEEVGFERIPDQLKVGIDMWEGSPELVLNAGGRSNWEQQGKNCRSFLELLQQSLQQSV